jgi:glycine/D-amino acid oxidase-like deaminating enzyme
VVNNTSSGSPEVDLIVVGAGVVGLAVCAELASTHPGRSVLLLDQAQPTVDAIARSASFVMPFAPTPTHRRLAKEAVSRFGFNEWRRCCRAVPALVVVDTVGRRQFQRSAIGGPLRVATTGEVHRMRIAYPDLLIRPNERVLSFGDRAFVVDVPELVADVTSGSRVAYRTDAKVVRVSRDNGHWAVGLSDGADLHASNVVLAVGSADLPDLGSDLARSLSPRVRSDRVSALQIRIPQSISAADSPPPAIYFARDDLCLLPDTDHVVASFPRATWRPDRTPVAEPFSDEETAVVLGRRSTSLSEAVKQRRALFEAYPVSRMPFVVRDTDAPTLVRIGGCSGIAVPLAPALAHRAVRALGL